MQNDSINLDLRGLISSIDPHPLDRTQWLSVLTAAKYKGIDSGYISSWSRQDSDRFDSKRFESEWKSCKNADFTGAVVNIAKEQGIDIKEFYSASELPRIPTVEDLKSKMIFGFAKSRNIAKDGIQVTIYDYQHEHNGTFEYCYSRVRFEGGAIPKRKEVVPRVINYTDMTYTSGCKGKPLCLYNIQNIVDPEQNQKPIAICEGEKDVDYLIQHYSDLFIPTTTGSCTSFNDTVVKYFIDRDVIIFRDNDDDGLKGATKVADLIKDQCRRYKIINPSTRHKGDIYDFLVKDGGSREDLLQMADETEWIYREDHTDLFDRSTIPLRLNKDNTPKNTLLNTTNVLAMDPEFDLMFLYNDFYKRVEINHNKAWWQRNESQEICDLDTIAISLYMEDQYNFGKKDLVANAISHLAMDHRYHPIKNILESGTWDGKPHIEKLLPKYLGSEPTKINTEVMTLFMVGAVARIYQPGIKFECVPVIIEKDQGVGKSSFCRFLALNDEFFSDDLTDINTDKDYQQLQGNWIIELGEMTISTNSKKSAEALKQFIGRQSDRYRVPYNTYPEDFKRQCVFIGTSNNISCLPYDPSGNRRYMPIMCDHYKAEKHPVEFEAECREDILQAYYEARALYLDGYKLRLSRQAEDHFRTYNQSLAIDDGKQGKIEQWLDDNDKTITCVEEIWRFCISETGSSRTRSESMEITKIMDNLDGWQRYQGSKNSLYKFASYGKQLAWERESKFEESDGNIPPEFK